jgi:hypothetical protein
MAAAELVAMKAVAAMRCGAELKLFEEYCCRNGQCDEILTILLLYILAICEEETLEAFATRKLREEGQPGQAEAAFTDKNITVKQFKQSEIDFEALG